MPTADSVVVELSVKLDKYQADVRAAKVNFEQAMTATETAATKAEATINAAANKIGTDTAGIGNASKRTAAIVEQANAAMGESATATATVVARASQLQTVEFAKQAAAQVRAAEGIKASSASVGSALSGLAGPIAAIFAVEKVAHLADEYTKFTNSLRATGLETGSLAAVQEKLFAVAQKYGTPLEALGSLYSRAAIAGKELGLSQGDLIKLSEGVAAAFKVAGTGASQQKGALTQLSEALGEPIVRARQFNSLLNDSPPIIQAAARGLDAAGGSVAKLGALIRSGSVSNKEFFDALVKGLGSTVAQADKFSLTISASFQILNNSLAKFIGESNESLSASDRFAVGIKGVADNLNTIVPALGVIIAGYGALRIAQGIAGSAAVQAARDIAVATEVQTKALGDQRTVAATLAVEEAARTRESVADIQLVVAERRAEIVALQAQGAALGEVAIATKLLATAERDLAIAEAEAVVAIEAETLAVAQAGIAARLSAASTALFSGALALLGGPIIAPIVLVVGALTAAFFAFSSQAKAAATDAHKLSEGMKDAATHLASLKEGAADGGNAVQAVGTQAGAATGPMHAFAGATGEAANKLYELAAARKADALAKTDAAISATRAGIAAGQSKLVADAGLNTSPRFATASREAAAQLAANGTAVTSTIRGRKVADPTVTADETALRAATAQLTGLVAARNAQANAKIETYAPPKVASPTAAEPVASSGVGRAATGAARSDDAAAKKAQDNAKSYADDIDTLNKELLAAAKSKALSAQQEADRAKREVDAGLKKSTDDITAKAKGKDPKLTGAQATEEIRLANAIAAARRETIDATLAEKQAADAFKIADQQFRLKESALKIEAQNAVTSADKRNAELKILDLQLEEIRLRTAAILADKQKSVAEKQEATAALKAAEQDAGGRRQEINRQTESPGQRFTRQTSDNKQLLGEHVEETAVNGLKALDDGLVNAVTHFKSLGDVAKNVFDTIVSGLVRIAIEKAIIGPLGDFLFGASGSSGGGALGGLLGRITGRASGGDVVGGQGYFVGENGPEFFTPASSGNITPNRSLAAGGGSGGVTIVQPHNFDLRGAVVTSDLIAQMQSMSDQAAMRGAAGGAQLAAAQSSRSASRALR